MRRVDVASDVVEELGRRLLDETEAFPSRYRVLFSLMNVKPSSLTREPLVSCLRTRSHGALLRHEVAYVLGQMQDGDEDAVTTLVDILSDKSDDVMVRHEAAEALGAIADTKCKRVLEKYLKDECKEVSDTCELALRRIEDVEKEKKEKKEKEEGKEEEKQVGSTSQFNTVDPILTQMKEKSLEELEKLALNESASMHDRYDAIFQLRNRASPSVAIRCFTQCLTTSQSALLKHEVAFVLGQLQNAEATQILVKILRDKEEHPMVRHEAAEALGSVAKSDKEMCKILEEYCGDNDLIVAQSCEVALDMLKNEGEFEYCETLA